MTVRIGHINFLNILPLTYSYKMKINNDIELTYGVPSKLNEMMKEGKLDISPISSIEYARQSENLLILPNICIRADKKVASIIFISNKPIESITNDKIILTSKSATSHCLLKIILSEGYGAKPIYKINNVDIYKPIEDEATGALLIGDDALYINENRPENLYCYDLGEEWYKLTGSSMVYAVWTVRREFAMKKPTELKFAYEKIIEGLKEGVKNKKSAIKSILNEKPFSYECLDNYLGEIIKWDLNTKSIESLKKFYEEAYNMKLINDKPEIKFINEY